MQWSNFVGHLLSFDSTVIPQRKPKEETIVRPAGFTSNLSSMDVPRVGIAAKKRKRRIIMIALGALGLACRDDSHLALETSGAQHRPFHRLDRYR